MLTPTGVTSAQYWSAIKAGNHTHIRITFIDQNVVLEDDDICFTPGLEVNDIFNGDTDLVMGKTLSKQITVSILNSSKLDGLSWTKEFMLEMGVEIGTPSVTYWVTIGYFSGEKPNNVTVSSVINFTAYDRMKKFDILADDFNSTVTYPATVQDIYDALCTYVGLSNDSGDELANIMSRSYNESPVEFEGYTCRDVLSWIAEACCCNAKINAAGNVQMAWFTDNTSHTITGNEEFDVESVDIIEGLTWNDADLLTWNEIDQMTWDDVSGSAEIYKIDQLMVKQFGNDLDVIYPNNAGENIYLIVSNPFLSVGSAQEKTNYIVPIYDRLDQFGGYLPVKIDCVGSWCVEAGDIVAISVNSSTLNVPIFVKTMRWNGAINDSYETTGNIVRHVYANEKNKEKVMSSNEIRLYVGNSYYEKVSGIGIDNNGVEITGNQYVRIAAGHVYDKWDFDSEGLTYEGHAIYSDIPSPTNYITFGISPFTGEFVPNVNAGLFPQFNDNANYCNLLLKAWKKRNDNKPEDVYLHISTTDTYDANEGYPNEGNQIIVFPDLTDGNNCSGFLGTSSNIWRRIYGETIYYGFLESLSSREYKEDIKPLNDYGEAIDKLQPISFKYKSESAKKSGGRTSYGLVYEDTVKILPEICAKHSEGEKEERKGINYISLIPILLKEVQSLRQRVAKLESMVGGVAEKGKEEK